ncbi:RsmB/NOP family class I SAM-dependent RNA methyltransferase [Nocardioides coralli]|uniref:RsmB/NOP family class I SAM-dependent RNA methyltransferase n=1 Tax=Nocardioides coralli TaxID=2872154 RepID=UPI001CA44B96|nr:transcription antitermination factor NusB [Nocardioides coralli]QZY30531.1 rRNA cytosine-C5-methyltransferase [Nocardioides coralli]
MADPARLAAYDVLRAVRVEDAYANLALPDALRSHRLSGRDAAFATELASGTLRRQGTYDAVVDACLTRGKVQPRVRDVLRLGVHQLLGMRVGTHAAVSATVDLAKARGGPRSAGLVNAVLRTVAEYDLDTWVARVAPDAATDPLGHLAVAHSHPRWVVEELGRALGDRQGELAELLAADNAAPGVVLVSRPGRSGPDELPGEPTSFSPYGVVLAGGDPASVPAVAEGRAGVQDEGSQLVAVAVAEAVVEGEDHRWLDLCAGPGGKAALLAALAAQRGATVVANEVQPHRAALVQRALAGADGVAGVTTYDGREPAWPAGSFDRVLVDAPCSGLGALRRRPEARWRKQPSHLTELVPLQEALLTSALELVRPGGVVVYATCSPVVAETAEVVGRVVGGRDDTRLEPVPLDVPDAVGPLPGTVQLWPHRHGTDAMFVAVLRRG